MTTSTRSENEEALLISLDGQGLDDTVYQACDLSTLEDLLIDQIERDGIGRIDGHEIGPAQTMIYLYGSDAEELFSRVQPILATYPLCQNSRVIIRHGGPGSRQREVLFPFS
jgi:hypothetical protein